MVVSVQIGFDALLGRASALTRQLGLFPEVLKALKAPWAFQSQLVIKVPEEQGHEDDEESDGGQKPQHLRRDWNTEGTGSRGWERFTSHHRVQVLAISSSPHDQC